MAVEKKRILMLLSNPFRPDPRVHKEARSLTEAGYEVTIICWDRAGKYPKRETLDGIEIIRAGPTYADRGLGKFPLMLARFWLKALGIARKLKPDIVHAHDFDTLPLGFDISKLHGAKLVYDAHEIYSAMLGPNGQDTSLGQLIDRIEGFLMRRADRVITVNEKIAGRLEKRGAKTSVVTNCPPLARPSSTEASSLRGRLSLGNEFMILYIGVLEPERFLEESVKALAGSPMENVVLVLGGFGSLEANLAKISQGRKNIKLLGRVKPELVASYTAESDVVMCIFDPRRNLNNELGSPNKVFDAMMSSKPVIVAKGTYAAELVGQEKCGVAINYNIESFLHAITQLIGSPEIARTLGQNARKAAEEKHNWETVSGTLLEAYNSL